MVLMALDHARDFFHFGALHGHDPLDLDTTSPALFLVRWITHFCAPVFVFLAGTGAYLSGQHGRSPRARSRFLLTRGLWLIVLEWTLVQWCGWAFAFDWHRHNGMVLWALGWSMICLAALVHLPLPVIGGGGLTLIAGHNLFDAVKPADLGGFGPWWTFLHEGGRIPLGAGHTLLAGYPLIPWPGVMAAGYAFGALWPQPAATRHARLWQLGAGLTALFLLLRFSNFYGNPAPWTPQATAWQTVGSFLDVEKYPPSLAYVLMTLGPALLLLAGWERRPPAWLRPLESFGRVPLFFYLLHLPLLHGLAWLVAWLQWGRADWLHGLPRAPVPPTAGFGLVGTALAWLAAVALLYPACRAFAAYKRRHRHAWLSYL